MDQLTERERLIIQLCADDNSSKMTADILKVSKRTITKHWQNIFAKTGLHSKAAVVWRYAALKPALINMP